uniref:Uncharacterized protein n=1 Tax=Lepeophtheirus salmonis TaxID=72036 RepID=A0A0K2UQL9_LEPSM|nr:uncharacterized protein LOC121118229 [Lepeophtheirus salmonis]
MSDEYNMMENELKASEPSKRRRSSNYALNMFRNSLGQRDGTEGNFKSHIPDDKNTKTYHDILHTPKSNVLDEPPPSAHNSCQNIFPHISARKNKTNSTSSLQPQFTDPVTSSMAYLRSNSLRDFTKLNGSPSGVMDPYEKDENGETQEEYVERMKSIVASQDVRMFNRLLQRCRDYVYFMCPCILPYRRRKGLRERKVD